MRLEKAAIDIIGGAGPVKRIAVLFNPSEYSIERTNTYKAASIPGLSGPLFSFINGEADALSMELFLDDYTDAPPDGRSVDDRLGDLASLLEIDRDLHAPPPVRFIWGRLSMWLTAYAIRLR